MESKRAEQIINENVAKFINRDEDYAALVTFPRLNEFF
jgi:hypothetical protein